MARKKKLLKTNFDFYSLEPLMKKCPRDKFYYYVIFGERSNGKSFAVLEYGIKDYLANGHAIGYIRRWDTDYEQGNTRKIWKGFLDNPYKGNLIKEWSKGRWNDIHYALGAWYFQRRAEDNIKDDEGNVVTLAGEILERDLNPFAYRFSLSTSEHAKSTGYPDIWNIVFDEFLTRKMYLPDEYMTFNHLLSTIVRIEDYARIFMIGNSVSTSSPYFKEMGLYNIKKMPETGAIDIYEYGESGLKVAVERTPNVESRKGDKKKSDVYFAFNNPSLKMKMITQGGWEIDIYPHLPLHYRIKIADVQYKFYIDYEDEIVQGDIIMKDESLFIYLHRKSTPLKDDNENLVYCPVQDVRPWYRTRITRPLTKLENLIAQLFRNEKVFYQDNELGEHVLHYLQWCAQ